MNKPDHIAVCVALSEMSRPHVPSRIARCWRCGTKVWVAPSTPILAVPTCTACSLVLMAEDDDVTILPPTPEQLRELDRYGRGPQGAG